MDSPNERTHGGKSFAAKGLPDPPRVDKRPVELVTPERVRTPAHPCAEAIAHWKQDMPNTREVMLDIVADAYPLIPVALARLDLLTGGALEADPALIVRGMTEYALLTDGHLARCIGVKRPVADVYARGAMAAHGE